MKLKRNIKVQVVDVLADYKVKIEKSPFIAILKYANEQDSNVVSLANVYEQLLKPLSLKACGNLMKRLCVMGYFKSLLEEVDVDDEPFELTSFGKKIAEEDVFFEKRRGVIRISLVIKNKLIPNKIIKIEEIRDDDRAIEAINKPNSILPNLQDKNLIIDLKTGSFTIDKIEEYYKVNNSKVEILSLEKYSDNFKLQILDFSSIINISEPELKSILLVNGFEGAYLKKKNILQIDFNPDNLNFIQNVDISSPYFKEQYFDSITLPKVKVSPVNFQQAQDWFFELVKSKVDRYFVSDKAFTDFVNKEARQFELYSKELKDTLGRQDFIDMLHPKNDFYIESRVETIDYLNY